jgi:carbon-monoxide dehydrogenase medium subunit
LRELHYESPTTVDEAVRALGRGDARALAGGTDLIVQLREGRRSAAWVVDLKRIPELTAITQDADGSFRIGSAVSFTQIAAHSELAAAYPGIAEAGRLVGSYQIQNRAGLGGNICNAAPSADAVPIVICLGASAEIAGTLGRRTVAVEELFAGPGRTTLAADEVLTSIRVPPIRPRSSGRYLRFTPRREMDIAIAGSGAWICLRTDDTIADARIVLASVAPVPLRAKGAEQSLIGKAPTPSVFAEAGRLAAREARPISDTRGSAEYRRELVAVLTKRALEACARDLRIRMDGP